MQIPFTAFAEDCMVTGEVDLAADRLADLLASTTEFEVGRAAFRALDDGRVIEAESCNITRNDLQVVLGTGPRGREDRRVWTRQHLVRARVGPYRVTGHLHAPPTVDPMNLPARRTVVALTGCVVEYVEAGAQVRLEAEVVLVNSATIMALETASDEDLLPAPDPDALASGAMPLEATTDIG